MEAKAKISREDIINAAFGIVRKGGWAKLSVRSVAKTLKSSAPPIYCEIKSREMIEEEVVQKAVALQAEYSSVPLTDNPESRNWIERRATSCVRKKF